MPCPDVCKKKQAGKEGEGKSGNVVDDDDDDSDGAANYGPDVAFRKTASGMFPP